MQKLLGVLLVLTGVSALFILIRFQTLINRPEPVVYAGSVEDNSPRILEIPELKLKLNVIDATISDGKWSQTANSVGYLTTSSPLGSNGNSVFYGHNRPNVLGRLNKIKKGSTIQITLGDGTVSKFEVYDFFEVTPDQLHILNPSETAKVTLYTCSGFLDSRRFVVLAKPAL